MCGKVNVPIARQEFNAAIVTHKNKNYAEIHRLRIKKEKQSNKLHKIKTVILRNSWLGEWIYSQEISFFTVFLKSIFQVLWSSKEIHKKRTNSLKLPYKRP